MSEASCRPVDGRCVTHDAYLVTGSQCSTIRKTARAALNGVAWNIRATRANVERPLERLDNVTL